MFYVVKNSGKQEPFLNEKILKALKNVGVEEQNLNNILKKIENEIYPDISTFEISKIIQKYLEKEKKILAIKFNLRSAMRKLGPDGFVFEKFVKEVFISLGFKATCNEYLKGKCISYETDLVAQKGKTKYIGECKYRNKMGDRVDVNVPLKTFAVMEDLSYDFDSNQKVKPIIITNEKFTSNAIKYSRCKKINLLGWRYPKEKGLEKIIDDNKLYPSTILPSYKESYLHIFAQEGLLLAKDFTPEKAEVLNRYKITSKIINQLIKEADNLLNN